MSFLHTHTAIKPTLRTIAEPASRCKRLALRLPQKPIFGHRLAHTVLGSPLQTPHSPAPARVRQHLQAKQNHAGWQAAPSETVPPVCRRGLQMTKTAGKNQIRPAFPDTALCTLSGKTASIALAYHQNVQPGISASARAATSPARSSPVSARSAANNPFSLLSASGSCIILLNCSIVALSISYFQPPFNHLWQNCQTTFTNLRKIGRCSGRGHRSRPPCARRDTAMSIYCRLFCQSRQTISRLLFAPAGSTLSHPFFVARPGRKVTMEACRHNGQQPPESGKPCHHLPIKSSWSPAPAGA